jgi:hypothetical protein
MKKIYIPTILIITILSTIRSEEILTYNELKQNGYVFITPNLEIEGRNTLTAYKQKNDFFIDTNKENYFITDEVYYLIEEKKYYFGRWKNNIKRYI